MLLSQVTFAITGTTYEGDNFSFETSFQSSDSEYITKVLSISNFSKSRLDVPVFVEEVYQTMLNWSYNNGYIRGINSEFVALPEARNGDLTSIANNLFQYQSPRTPWVVSELRGNKVYNLFKFVSISDGDAANTQVKISIMNMSFNNSTFDIMVRSFFDTDANPVVLEKYTNCTMDPNSNSFVAKKIGSSDGEYPLNSAYIMIELSEEYPIDALPCGFEGYTMRDYQGNTQSPIPIYKTAYNFPGQVIYNPPFGTTNGGSNVVTSSGDNVRRTFLGFSNTIGIDESFLQFKGFQNIANHCGTNWDIYRESRTNTDEYILGASGYLKGACPTSRYPSATGWGAFRDYAYGDNVSNWGNSDYYAYQLGITTFANPEATNINVFVSPGIDYVNNSGLVEYAVDMVEDDRADSIYICTTPDYDMFLPTTYDR